MLFTIFIIVAILLGLALVGLGINILFRKNGKFPETHIGKNKAMKDRGIHCANTTDRLDRQNYKPAFTEGREATIRFEQPNGSERKCRMELLHAKGWKVV